MGSHDTTQPRPRRDMINGQIDFLKELARPGEPRSLQRHFPFYVRVVSDFRSLFACESSPSDPSIF